MEFRSTFFYEKDARPSSWVLKEIDYLIKELHNHPDIIKALPKRVTNMNRAVEIRDHLLYHYYEIVQKNSRDVVNKVVII